MKLKQTILAGLLMAPFFTHSAVTVEVPTGLQMLTVNGKDAGYSNFGFDSNKNIQLEDGVNQIAFRISKIVRETGQEKTKYKSQPMVATFYGKDALITFKVPNITTLAEGSVYNDNPTFELIVKSGEINNIAKGQLGVTFALAADLEKEIATFNKTKAPASLANYQKIAPEVPTLSGDSYTDLKASFKAASLEERKKFLTWAISNLDE
ncbi:putative secreted protein [Vibrio maritimus]|uniref:Putative secreted protein n=1 Tax=Vibrio maritimus TaxID=990268 RepID=A0A090T2L3_9VIBR|nr:putative secreted protein [Vibrio maritimus]